MDSEGFPVFVSFRNQGLFLIMMKLLKEVQGIQFVSLKKSNMYFVITTRNNVSAITYIQFLARISNLIRDFCGTLNEESVRQNFTLIYEILDEIIDNGFIQDCNTKLLKSFISNEPVEVEQQSSILQTLSNTFSVSILLFTIDIQ